MPVLLCVEAATLKALHASYNNYFFFTNTREKRSPCSYQKRTRPTRPCTHVCPTHARQLLSVISVTVSSDKFVILMKKMLGCRISKVAMGNECGGRWTVGRLSIVPVCLLGVKLSSSDIILVLAVTDFL